MIVLLGKEKAQSNKDKQHLQQHVKRSTKKLSDFINHRHQ